MGTRKHWLAACVLLVACLAVLGGIANGTDREEAGLHGMVKSVIAQEAGLSQSFGTWVEGPRHTVSAAYYDTSGWKTEDQEFSDGGVLVTKRLYTYKAEGTLHEMTDYSASGRLTGVLRHEYDAAGRALGSTRYSASGEIESKSTDHLDATGRTVAVDFYGPDGVLSNHMTYAYDSTGHEVENCMYKGSGVLSLRFTYEYDVSGTKTRVTLCTYNDDGALGITTTTTYDKNGNDEYTTFMFSYPLSLVATDSRSRYEYVLDTQGNWTKKTESEEVAKFGQTYWEPKKVTHRTILYY